MLTAHWVHFSYDHLFYNLAVLVATGWLIKARDRGDPPRLYALAASCIGIALFVAQPDLRIFCGGSGVAYAFVTYLALCGLRDAGAWRWLCMTLLAVVSAKLLAEQLWGCSLVARDPDASLVAVPLSHAAGIAAGTSLWLWRVVAGVRASTARSPASSETESRLGRWIAP